MIREQGKSRAKVGFAARIGALSIIAAAAVISAVSIAAAAEDDAAVARSLAEMLRASRAVISAEQARIDDPDLGDKGLDGRTVLVRAVAAFKTTTGIDPETLDPASRQGRLLRAMMGAIVEVVDANQTTINAQGTGFKGFIPAVFARLVDEAFSRAARGDAEVKVTAPPELIRNRRARPDPWEAEIIADKLLAPGWPRDQAYSAVVSTGGREAFRVMVPEYYSESCLACHGTPKGAMDKTGYPKEGRTLDDLGGVISITLFH
jgi:Protein of unknown function (DUF3365)